MKKSQIREAVINFFEENETVFAIVDTENHSANFYGCETICELTIDDVVSCVETAQQGWRLEEHESALELVLSDLQHERPEDD